MHDSIQRYFTIILCSVLLPTLFTLPAQAQTFRHEQVRYARVRSAIAEKESVLKALCASKDLSYPPRQIFLRAFKHEQLLEVWAKDGTDTAFTLLKEYSICALSGELGPKRRFGDGQIPEGFYTVDAFNPNSSFHLSLRVNYPNRSDRILGSKGSPGNNICIHGNCVTIGCVPITDDKIKEVYLLAVEARSSGQQAIPVHIFPARMNDGGMKILREYANEDTLLLKFWANLKQGYDFFDLRHAVPGITVNRKGTYLFQN